MTTALTRMLSTMTAVVASVATIAMWARPARPGMTTCRRYSASPSASAACPSAPPKRLRPSAISPHTGPSVRPMIEYSPPVSGKADASSA